MPNVEGDADRGPDADGEEPTSERDPDIAEGDRFSVNGRAMPFRDWVAAVMEPIARRDPPAAEAQPSPEPPEVVWLARRPTD